MDNLETVSSAATIREDLEALGDHVLDHSVGIVSARAVLDGITKALRSYEQAEVQIAVGSHLLRRLEEGTTQASFLEQVAGLCDVVATAQEREENYVEAARLLAAIPLDGSARRVSQEDKVRVWVRIVRDYLEVDDSTAAEAYLNKLKGVIFDVADAELNLHFRLSQARINDAKREFLAASTAYHDISYSAAVAEDDRLHTLSMAIKCAILAPAGPTRSRVLARLYKDDRAAAHLPDDYAMLEKIFLNRLLAPAEVDKFAQGLQPHQLATTADGSTVLAKAIVEHNLLGVSRLYRNIQLAHLAALLGLEPARAEDTTARMIEQGRLLGRIDQIAGLVWFEGGDASGVKGSGRAESAVDRELRQWDANVQGLAEEVENITNQLQRQFPDFVARNLVV